MKIRQDAPVTYAARAQPNGAPPPNESYPPFAYNYPYGQPPLLVPLNYPSPSSSAPVVSTASVISGRSGSEIHRLTLHAQRPCPELDIVLGFLLGFCSLLCSFLLFLAFLRWLFRKAGLHKLTAGKVAEKLTGSWDKGKKEKVQVTPPDSYSPSNSKQNGLEDAEYQQGTTSPTDAPPSNYNPLAGYEHHNPITARTASLYNRLVNKLNTTVEMMSGLKTSAKSNSPRRHHETQQKERDKFRDVTGGRFVPDGEWESTARGVAVSNVKGGRPVRKTGHQKHHRSLRTTPSSPVTVQLFGGHQTPLNFNICYGDNHERFTKTVDVYASTGTLEREDESHTKVNRYRIGETIKKEAGSETVTPWAPSDNESPSASTAATENVHRFKSGPFVSELKESVVQAAQTQYPTGNNAAVQTEVIPVFVRETLTEANTSVYRGADIQWKDQSPSPPINETETDWDERLAHFKAMNRDFKISRAFFNSAFLSGRLAIPVSVSNHETIKVISNASSSGTRLSKHFLEGADTCQSTATVRKPFPHDEQRLKLQVSQSMRSLQAV
ncbi:unnamed protein product [Cyprideis torosa]|uniref:Uncharacterized protein n=1 Tax=Cyprideis torosa TaxID=163714 RepID=A0A7R8W6F8_9CRUS|nr:unnamed protein product [Cyprideis torosa]CAG0886455.1 unnamed protein product [Cyprideis torosa]